MRIQRPLPAALAEALAIANMGGDQAFELPGLVLPVVIWPTRERAAELERVIEGRAFIGFASCGGLAANFSHVQLWNPLTSGRRIILSDLWLINLAAAAAIGLVLRRATAALSTAFTNLSPQAKRLGGGISPAEQRFENNVAAIGVDFARFSLPANVTTLVPFKEPIVLEPGNALNISNDVVAVTTAAAWQFTEELIV